MALLVVTLLCSLASSPSIVSDESWSKWKCPEPNEAWCQPSQPLDERIASLISRLSFDEKMTQLQNREGGGGPFAIPRLGLGKYTTSECLHGTDGDKGTVFPQSISLAATFDEVLMREIGQAIGAELRADYNAFERSTERLNYTMMPPSLSCLAPVMNLARDPRWGRAQETYGESPLMAASLGAAYVRGLQGDDERYILAVATPKHIGAYGGATARAAPVDGDVLRVAVSWLDWVETFTPAFAATVKPKARGGAGALSTMCGYSSLCISDSYHDGYCAAETHNPPACASPELLNATLRAEWGFEGYVISDNRAITKIQTVHHWADSQASAAAVALKAGCDVALELPVACERDGAACNTLPSCQPDNVVPGCDGFAALANATTQGLVREVDIDVAVGRALRARFALGHMDERELCPYSNISEATIDSSKHRQLALDAAHKSVVLLTNRHAMLPLARDKFTIAAVGPNADVLCYGSYAGTNPRGSTVVGGLRRFQHISYARGCDIDSRNRTGFDDAIGAAAAADVTISVMGLDPSVEYDSTSGKGDRSSISLPGVQHELLTMLRHASKRLVVVLVGGSAMAVPWEAEHADALLWAGYGGEAAGDALANIVFGEHNPSARLPVTFYRNDDQLPPFDSYDMRRPPGRTFRFLLQDPLFAFGAGMSYSTFEYDGLQVAVAAQDLNGSSGRDGAVQTVPPCSSLALSFNLTNAGPMAGDEVTQLYLSFDPLEQPAAPMSLVGFRRLHAVPLGTTRRIEMQIGSEAMLVVVAANRTGWRWLPATVRIWVGGRMPTLAERKSGRAAHSGMLQQQLRLAGPPQSCPSAHPSGTQIKAS